MCIFTIYTAVRKNVVVLKSPQYSAVSCKNALRQLTGSEPSGIKYVQLFKHGHNFAVVSIPLYCTVLISAYYTLKVMTPFDILRVGSTKNEKSDSEHEF